MKSPIIALVISPILFGLVSCAKNTAQSEKARTEAEAKVRAEAARKEMETLPKVFRTPDYFKKNEPAKSETTQPRSETQKK